MNKTSKGFNSFRLSDETEAILTSISKIINNISKFLFWLLLEYFARQNCFSFHRNRRDTMAINFWQFSTQNSVISATTFIKNGPNFPPQCLFQAPRLLKSRNQVAQLPTTSLLQARHQSNLENVLNFHIKVWK